MKFERKALPKWVRWLAQDADGKWWGYEHEPHLGEISWYENEVGQSEFIKKSIKNKEWKRTLQKITE